MAKEAIETYNDVEAMRQHHIGWMAQRVYFGVLATTLILGGLGIFGGGPISEKTLEVSPGLSLTYQRYVRENTENQVTINNNTGEKLVVAIPVAMLAKYEIEDIEPWPQRLVKNGMVIYDFSPHDGDPGAYIHLRPETSGRQHHLIRINGHAVSFNQFVWP